MNYAWIAKSEARIGGFFDHFSALQVDGDPVIFVPDNLSLRQG
jgi:hypothetical protein